MERDQRVCLLKIIIELFPFLESFIIGKVHKTAEAFHRESAFKLQEKLEKVRFKAKVVVL